MYFLIHFPQNEKQFCFCFLADVFFLINEYETKFHGFLYEATWTLQFSNISL